MVNAEVLCCDTANKTGRVKLPAKQCLIMGIVNVTPDSFSDGGCFIEAKKAVKHALNLIDSGAAIIDIGGESTRPGSKPVSVAVQIKRVVPVIAALRKQTEILISIDTTSSQVASAALDAGADIVNDISALRFDPELIKIVAAANVPLILMHMQGIPGNMQKNPDYLDVVQEVSAFLEERRNFALTHGVKRDNIILDPGFGFGKKQKHNLSLLQGLGKLVKLGSPLLVGVSRKSFIGAVLGREVSERLYGSLALAAFAAWTGAAILRVHDVKETCDLVRMLEAVKKLPK